MYAKVWGGAESLGEHPDLPKARILGMFPRGCLKDRV